MVGFGRVLTLLHPPIVQPPEPHPRLLENIPPGNLHPLPMPSLPKCVHVLLLVLCTLGIHRARFAKHINSWMPNESALILWELCHMHPQCAVRKEHTGDDWFIGLIYNDSSNLTKKLRHSNRIDSSECTRMNSAWCKKKFSMEFFWPSNLSEFLSICDFQVFTSSLNLNQKYYKACNWLKF